MKRAALIFAAFAVAFAAPAAPVRTATESFVTNKIAEAVAAIPAPDYSPTNAELRATIEAVAPSGQPPANYAAVSNAAMHAVTRDEYGMVTVDNMQVHDLAVKGASGWPEYRILFGPNDLDGTYLYWNADSGRFATWRTAYGGDYLATALDVANSAVAATNYTDLATNALAMSTASALGSYLPLSGGLLTGSLSLSGAASIQYTGVWYVRLYANVGEAGNRIYTNEGDTWQSERGLAWFDETTNHVHTAAVAATNYTNASISPTNPTFAAAVRNVPIAGADSSDLAEIAEYGSYGTIGAAILALIAGLAALKRGKADKAELPYDIVAVTPANGVVTVGPRTIAIYTAGDSAAAFDVAVGTGETGKARDCELVIDCTATGAVAPTVTWPATFHPRTDAATDFACETGKRNVYFISEFASGEYAVGGWQETAGGNA